MFALGSLAASTGDHTRAAQFFRAAITCDCRQALAHFALGSVLFLQEQYTEALSCYNRAIALNGDVKEFFHNRALVHRRLGMWEALCPHSLCSGTGMTLVVRYDEAMTDYTTPSIMNHRAIEKQILSSASADADDDAVVAAEAPRARHVEAAKSSIITQALATQPPRRLPSQVNIICNSLLSNPFFKMQPTPLQPDIAAHLVLLDVPAGEIAISEVGTAVLNNGVALLAKIVFDSLSLHL